jgi:nicotinamidase-related amidase
MRIDRERSVLVLVDYQRRLLPAIAEADAVVAEALFVARVAAALGVPVIGTEQNPDGLGPCVDSVRSACATVLPKSRFDATADGLTDALRTARPAVADVVVAGCEAHVCLMQTALGLLDAGWRVAVVADACGSRRADDKALALRRLERAGALIVSAEMLVFEWLGSCEAPGFRDVLALVKTHAARRIGAEGGRGA